MFGARLGGDLVDAAGVKQRRCVGGGHEVGSCVHEAGLVGTVLVLPDASWEGSCASPWAKTPTPRDPAWVVDSGIPSLPETHAFVHKKQPEKQRHAT